MHQQQKAFENIVGKEEIARNEPFLLLPQYFLLNQKIAFPFVNIYDISLFAAELEETKIGMWCKRVKEYNYLPHYLKSIHKYRSYGTDKHGCTNRSVTEGLSASRLDKNGVNLDKKCTYRHIVITSVTLATFCTFPITIPISHTLQTQNFLFLFTVGPHITGFVDRVDALTSWSPVFRFWKHWEKMSCFCYHSKPFKWNIVFWFWGKF